MAIERAELLAELKRVSRIVDRSPAECDMLEHGNFAYSTYFRYFESWSRAKALAGVADPTDTKISDQELLSELERVEQIVEGSPTRREIDRLGKYPSSTYKHRFGSWNAALNNAELPLNEPSPGEGVTDYGPNWDEYRKRVLKRDDHSCRVCGEEHVRLHVHHITPLREFEKEDGTTDYARGHAIDNLVTVCPSCHKTNEGRYRDCNPDEFARRARTVTNEDIEVIATD